MIRINLLEPLRKNEREDERGFSIRSVLRMGLALMLLGFIGAWGLWTLWLYQKHESLLKEKGALQEVLGNWKQRSKDTEWVEPTYSTLMERSRFREKQAGQKYLPVVLLDSISRSINPLNIWLLRLGMSGKDVEVVGLGWEAEDVYLFIDSLEENTIWAGLSKIETRKESYQNHLLYHFNFNFTLGSQ